MEILYNDQANLIPISIIVALLPTLYYFLRSVRSKSTFHIISSFVFWTLLLLFLFYYVSFILYFDHILNPNEISSLPNLSIVFLAKYALKIPIFLLSQPNNLIILICVSILLIFLPGGFII